MIYKKYKERKYVRKEIFKIKNLINIRYYELESVETKKSYQDKLENLQLHERYLDEDINFLVAFTLGIVSIFVGISSIIFGILNLDYIKNSIKISEEANVINREVSKIEYYNAQPYLIIEINEDQDFTNVKVKNSGKGVATNIYLLKHFSFNNKSNYGLSKEYDIQLSLDSGKEVYRNFSFDVLRILNKNEIFSIIDCLPSNYFDDSETWVSIIYENIKGEKFATKMFGQNGSYNKTTKFITLNNCGD